MKFNGEKMRELRTAKIITIKEFASDACLDKDWIVQIELGYGQPSLWAAVRISELLDTTVNNLIIKES